MEDAADSKSVARKGVGVRVPLPVPTHSNDDRFIGLGWEKPGLLV